MSSVKRQGVPYSKPKSVSPNSAERPTRRLRKEPFPVKEYDIFIPLYYNDGTSIEPKKFQKLQTALLEHFDGLTFFPQPNEGFWKMANVTYRDEIVIYRVLSKKRRSARSFLSKLKATLKDEFQQEEILIVERDVDTL
jgi:hypothetical protein